ncbi:MAG: hypothetical protein ACK4TI_03525 [Nitrososphaerales archaeon]
MTSKKPDLIVKDIVKVEDKDYRGVLAIILTLAWITFLALGRCEAAAAIGPFAGSAVTWWFNRKRRRRR